MTLWTNPEYVALAQLAARQLGADHPATVAAILAQWTCEQGTYAPWPPVYNNPGNLTSAIGTLDGEPHTVGRYIGGGAFLYAYSSPQAGALGYANYLLRSSLYHVAIAAARAGDAKGFLTAVCNAGYGTRLTCCLGILPHIAPVQPAPPPAQRWECLARAVNVRTGPGVAYPVVGSVRDGGVVAGPVVSGGRYRVGIHVYSSWIRIGPSRYTARAFYRSV